MTTKPRPAAGLMFVGLLPALSPAYEIGDGLTAGAALTGVYQYGDFDAPGVDETGRGAVALDLSGNFHPTETDELQVTVGFAADNALNDRSPFSLAPYADDLEDDLEDINNRNRDALLEAWYKRTIPLGRESELGITGGIVDATGYVDGNRFANDEVGQFMNDVFVNSTVANLPSYDLGAAAELDAGAVSVRGVVMNSRTEEDRSFNYYAAQLAYRLDSALGEGNYRVYGFGTTATSRRRPGAVEGP